LLKESFDCSRAPAATPSVRTTVHARAEDVNDLASANLPLIGDTLTQCDPFGISSTSHWTGAAIFRKWSRTKTCVLTRGNIVQADALLFGRVTYEMMEAAWRLSTRTVTMSDWTEPFGTDDRRGEEVCRVEHLVDWNAELIRGDLGQAVQQLKQEPGKGLFTGGVTLPLALKECHVMDERLRFVPACSRARRWWRYKYRATILQFLSCAIWGLRRCRYRTSS
jgi:hypothetical protein